MVHQGPCDDARVCPVGIPQPETPEMMTEPTVAATEYTFPRNYIVTYCRGCDEGPPSKPSNTECLHKDDMAGIVLPQPDADACVDEIHVYRLMPIAPVQADAIAHPEQANNNLQNLLNLESEAEYFLVASVPVGTPAVMDNGSFQGKARTSLMSMDNDPPPMGLCIVGETPAGSMVGFKDSFVYFSERNTYHGWPVKNRVRLDFNIVDVTVCDNTVYAFTTNGVYVMEDDADCKDATCRRPRYTKCPMVLLCLHAHLTVADGVIFATRTGLVRMARDGSYQLISRTWFTPDDWRRIDPASIRMARHEGMLFFTTALGTWIMDLDLDNAGVEELNLSTTTIRPEQWLTGNQGELYFLFENVVYQWNAGAKRMTYRWRQAPQNLCDEHSVGAYKILFENLAREKNTYDPVWVSVFNDAGCIDARQVCSQKSQTIGSNRSYESSIEIRGRMRVRVLRSAANVRCLEQRNAA